MIGYGSGSGFSGSLERTVVDTLARWAVWRWLDRHAGLLPVVLVVVGGLLACGLVVRLVRFASGRPADRRFGRYGGGWSRRGSSRSGGASVRDVERAYRDGRRDAVRERSTKSGGPS